MHHAHRLTVFLGVVLVLLSGSLRSVAASTNTASENSNNPAEVLEHSMFSWDYSRPLGSLTWWNNWFPACKSRYQGPVTIDWVNGITKSDDTLVIERTSGLPLRPMDAVVAYNSTFNTVRCDMSADAARFYIYWKPADDSVSSGSSNAYKGPEFRLEQLSFFFPSEHKYMGDLTSAEIRYVFESMETFPLTNETPLTNTIDEWSDVSFSILLKEADDDNGRKDIEMLLRQLIAGYDSGVARITPQLPAFAEGLVHYKGSETAPPCRGNMHHFVAGAVLPIETSTLKKFRQYGPIWKDYRTTVDPDGRPVRRVAFNPTGLIPQLRTTPYVAPHTIYKMNEVLLKEQRDVALYYGAVMAGAVVAVLLFTLVVLVVQRLTYQVPFSASWRLPKKGREVFGVPVRYGRETGQPRPVRGAALSYMQPKVNVPSSPVRSQDASDEGNHRPHERPRVNSDHNHQTSSNLNSNTGEFDMLGALGKPMQKR